MRFRGSTIEGYTFRITDPIAFESLETSDDKADSTSFDGFWSAVNLHNASTGECVVVCQVK